MRVALCRVESRYYWADGRCSTLLPMFCWGFRGVMADILSSRFGNTSDIESPIAYKSFSSSDPSNVLRLKSGQHNN